MIEHFGGKPLKIMALDIEIRPLHWIAGDYVGTEITCMAWQFIGERAVSALLGPMTTKQMLEKFLVAYSRADIISGHYLRGFDLPRINGAMLEFGFRPLSSKLTHDTKLDLVKFQGLSKSQENLGATLKLQSPKIKMDQYLWRQANRLEPKGIRRARERVIGDVKQNLELRAVLMKQGFLGPPKLWTSGSGRIAGSYEA